MTYDDSVALLRRRGYQHIAGVQATGEMWQGADGRRLVLCNDGQILNREMVCERERLYCPGRYYSSYVRNWG